MSALRLLGPLSNDEATYEIYSYQTMPENLSTVMREEIKGRAILSYAKDEHLLISTSNEKRLAVRNDSDRQISYSTLEQNSTTKKSLKKLVEANGE